MKVAPSKVWYPKLHMEISQNTLKKIFLGLIGLAILLSVATIYFYFPTLMNRFGLNKTPSPQVQKLLTDYNMTQTAERYLEMDQEVGKLAKSTPSLDITNCTPYPRITKVDINLPLKVTNSDTKSHTLSMNGQTFEILPGSSRDISLNFVASTPNVLPYSCDDLNTFTGILYATGSI